VARGRPRPRAAHGADRSRGGGATRGALAVLAATLAAALALGGCSSGAYSRLVPERQVPDCADCLAARAAIPSETRLVPVARPDGRVVRIAVERLGRGTSGTTAVLIHGVFSDRRAWRYLSRHLADRPDGTSIDAVLVDLPGCGASDKPDPDAIDAREYSPTAMADIVLAALESPASPMPRGGDVVLVGHSLGGAVILRALGEPTIRTAHAGKGVLERVRAAVLLAAAHPAMDPHDERLDKVMHATAFEAVAGHAIGLVRDRAAQSAEAEALSWPALREEADRTVECFLATDRRRAGQRMLRLAALRDESGAFDRAESDRLVAQLGTITTPTLILWGDRDDVLPYAFGPRCARDLPHARLVTFPGGSHSLAVEAARACATLVVDFARASGKGAADPK